MSGGADPAVLGITLFMMGLQIIVAERGPLVFVFNFSPFNDYEGYKVIQCFHHAVQEGFSLNLATLLRFPLHGARTFRPLSMQQGMPACFQDHLYSLEGEGKGNGKTKGWLRRLWHRWARRSQANTGLC